MTLRVIGWSLMLFVSVLALTGCRGESAPADAGSNPAATPAAAAPPAASTATPAEFAGGEALFTANCARCHGGKATGANQGPPLIHKIYEPSHHADVSFQLAVRNGVRPHHWKFGPMPPIPGVGEADVNEIIGYVRWLQRQAGIF